MKLGTSVPMGPLTLADFIGLDTCLAIMEVLHDGFKDSKYRPSPLLRKYVEAGWLGRKSGRFLRLQQQGGPCLILKPAGRNKRYSGHHNPQSSEST